MSRVKITEYRAKKLIVGDDYKGISLKEPKTFSKSKNSTYVVKVDQGIKKRFKNGLVRVNVDTQEISKSIQQWKKKGFDTFLVEPFVPHTSEEEQYFSLERVRGGIRLLHAKNGGIDIEAHPESVYHYTIHPDSDLKATARITGIPHNFLSHVVEVFNNNHFSFLEINPLLIRGEEVFLLDAAVLVDSAGIFDAKVKWNENDLVIEKATHAAEISVKELQKTSPASFKLTVLHPDGALFFLLSGGGGSIVIADEAKLSGVESLIGNYGEYSGGPTREETYLYTRVVLNLMLKSKGKQKKKALIVAGGVANFTDIKTTFSGVVDALQEKSAELRKAQVRVFVRRGGPHEALGLRALEEYLLREKLFGSIHGSDIPITSAVDEAIEYVKKTR